MRVDVRLLMPSFSTVLRLIFLTDSRYFTLTAASRDPLSELSNSSQSNTHATNAPSDRIQSMSPSRSRVLYSKKFQCRSHSIRGHANLLQHRFPALASDRVILPSTCHSTLIIHPISGVSNSFMLKNNNLALYHSRLVPEFRKSQSFPAFRFYADTDAPVDDSR